MSGSALTPSHENGTSWFATLPRTERMNAKAAKVAKGAAVAAQLIASLTVTRGGQLCDLSGLCVHRRGCDRSLTRPWGEQSVAFSEQITKARRHEGTKKNGLSSSCLRVFVFFVAHERR